MAWISPDRQPPLSNDMAPFASAGQTALSASLKNEHDQAMIDVGPHDPSVANADGP